MWFRDKFKAKELENLDKKRFELREEIENLTTFTIEAHHLLLIKRMDFDWEFDEVCYEGMLVSNDKRPFGNKAWDIDVSKAKGISTDDYDDYDVYMKWYKKNYLENYRTFLEMRIVLLIICQNAGKEIKPGDSFEKQFFCWTFRKNNKE